MKTVLVVDDEEGIRESLRMILDRAYRVVTASSGFEALKLREREQPDAVFLDILMPGMDGLKVLEEVRKVAPDLPVIMVTATQTVKTAVAAMKLGAYDYLTKPFDVRELMRVIENAIKDRELTAARPGDNTLKEDQPYACRSIVGTSRVIQYLQRAIAQVSTGNSTVLVTGESGTGKELIAHAIHQNSARHNGPFIPINCAAIPESLIESELFGYEKGAFTDAKERRIGRFEQADGGTLFLDEIGELSLFTQAKLLRVLQQREFVRLGGGRPVQVDVRVISATNRNLEEAVSAGIFRQDLYYRINVVPIHIPPLRERIEDIPLLVEHFLTRWAEEEMPIRARKKMSREALEILMDYSWPGNVRELMNVIERCCVLCEGSTVWVEDIPSGIRDTVKRNSLKDAVIEGVSPFGEASKEFEYDIIIEALRKANYVQTEAAGLLGISRRILKYKMDKLGITPLARR